MDNIEIPKVFWKFFDLYRRKVISFAEFSSYTGISRKQLEAYLSSLEEI